MPQQAKVECFMKTFVHDHVTFMDGDDNTVSASS